MSQSRPTTQRGRDLVSSLVGSIKKTTISGNRRRSPYGRVAADDCVDDHNVDGKDGDYDVEENLREQEINPISHDAEDYRNFSIDDCDCDDNGICISDDDEELPHSILQHQSPSVLQSPLSSRHASFPNDDDNNIHHHCQSQSPIPPQNYICPLTLQLMEHPVRDGCGHIFERRAIVEWLETNSNDKQETICPISRKPMIQLYNRQFDDTLENGNQKYEHVLRSDSDLQRRILEWKLNYPLYQGVDADYVKHQREKILYHHEYPYGCCDRDSNNYDDDSSTRTGGTCSSHHPHLSRFELMLLPQERQVLKIVKTQARLKRERTKRSRRRYNCLLASVVVAVVLLISSYVVVQNRNGGLAADSLSEDDDNEEDVR